MKAIAAVLSCGLVLSMIASPASADPWPAAAVEAGNGPDRIKQLSEPHDSVHPKAAESTIRARRELKRDDLIAAFALLFLGQVPQGSQGGMAAQLTLK